MAMLEMLEVETPSKRKEMYTHKDLWIKLFDRSTPEEFKRSILGALRGGVEEVVADYRNRPNAQHTEKFFKRMQKGVTVAIVMTRGYSYRDLYAFLKNEHVAERYVLVGFSSGMWCTNKKFADGTSMVGSIYMPREDIESIKQRPDAPILFTDDAIISGLTVSLIGKAFKEQLGHTGKLYQADHHMPSPRKWNGVVHDLRRPEMMRAAREAQILGEQQELSAIKRK